MIGTQIFRDPLPSNRSIEHPTQCRTIDDVGVDFESDNPTLLLRACSDHFCARRKCRFTQGVFGMKVGRYNINLRVFAGLAHFTKNRLVVSYAVPVSTTSVARLPTTMPTFGKPATLPSGIT